MLTAHGPGVQSCIADFGRPTSPSAHQIHIVHDAVFHDVLELVQCRSASRDCVIRPSQGNQRLPILTWLVNGTT